MYKPLSDSTLMNMSKREIIEHLRIAEHNHKVCEETINQQVENFKRLLKEERQQYIDKVVEQLEEEREYSFANFYDYVEDCSPCLDTDDDYFHRGIERAIKIVKAGGKE